MLHDSESLHSLGIEQAGERLLAWRTGEERIVTVAGGGLRLMAVAAACPAHRSSLHLLRGRTHIRVYSNDLDEDALVEIAVCAPAGADRAAAADRGVGAAQPEAAAIAAATAAVSVGDDICTTSAVSALFPTMIVGVD